MVVAFVTFMMILRCINLYMLGNGITTLVDLDTLLVAMWAIN